MSKIIIILPSKYISVISRLAVLNVKETGVPEENHSDLPQVTDKLF
jgi:hypothetical protein